MENIINEMSKKSFFNQDDRYDGQSRWEILGICYVPIQKWEQIYDEDTAYSAGTLFPGLNKPFLGGGK